jgi:outer membrane protein TolC
MYPVTHSQVFSRSLVHGLLVLLMSSVGAAYCLAEGASITKSIPIENKAALSYQRVLQKVLTNDFALQRSELDALAFQAEAEAKDVLPDPVIVAAIQNLPTDTFDTDQEAMTQFRLGVKQMFPKGDSLSLNKQIISRNSTLQTLQAQQRVLQLRQQTEMAWLEAWYWQKTKTLIEQDRTFLTQMQDFMQSMYQLGGNNQSDLIGAELELIKLDEKLMEADQQYQAFRLQLNTLARETLPGEIEDEAWLALTYQPLLDRDALFDHLSQHPALKLVAEKVSQSADKVALSEQDFEPQWGLELAYGLREGENPNGSERADFFSAGVSVQVPLFSRPQKTQSVRAARYQQSAFENQYREQLETTLYELQSLDEQYRQTRSQRQLYETKILPTLAKQKNSALQSYESDKGDFRVVTDLYIKEQATKIKHQRLRVNEQRYLSKMNYWLNQTVETTQ